MSGPRPVGLDWAGLMRAGLSELRLPPEVFWKLSPIELRIMLGVDAAQPPLTRARLEELAAAFPDLNATQWKGPENDHGARATRSDHGT